MSHAPFMLKTPAPADAHLDTAIAWRALALGVAFDIATNGQQPGLSIPLFFLALVGGARRWLLRGRDEGVLIVAAAVFAMFPVFRASEWLIALDLLACIGLLTVAAARSDRELWRTNILDLIARALHVVASLAPVPGTLLAPAGRAFANLRPSRVRRFLRAFMITAPILVVFALLLASADQVFGDLLLPNLPSLDLAGAAGHVGLWLVGAIGSATLIVAARRQVGQWTQPPAERARPLRSTEWSAVLIGLNLLFTAFMVVQLAVLFGGNHHVEVTKGLTYAEYARSGFFQLLAVAALTLFVILGCWDLGERTRDRRFRWLVTGMVGLTGVILVSAVMRMSLYARAFGFTLNRLIATTALLTIGACLIVLVIAIWARARERIIVSFGACALIALLALNVIDAERFVAAHNVERFHDLGKLDASYLATLGVDAVPVTVTLLDEVRADDAAAVRAGLCDQLAWIGSSHGFRSYNAAREEARRALDGVGLNAQACASTAN